MNIKIKQIEIMTTENYKLELTENRDSIIKEINSILKKSKSDVTLSQAMVAYGNEYIRLRALNPVLNSKNCAFSAVTKLAYAKKNANREFFMSASDRKHL